MPFVEDQISSHNSAYPLPVVIIGNGPSGICLSYFLSGYRPYFAPDATHPNPILQCKLEESRSLSLVDQDLQHLSEGLEGRSSNPVSLLFDALILPESDFGQDYESTLEWKLEPGQSIPHVVLGRGPPGGAWHAMEGSMLTLSLANWMELPGLKLKDWVREKRRNLRNDRATPDDIASYYVHFVNKMGLQDNFLCGTCVTSLRRIPCSQDGKAKRLNSGCKGACTNCTVKGAESEVAYENVNDLWEVSGYRERKEGKVHFSICAKNVVLATGTHDTPAWLGVDGEDLPYVCHSLSEFEAAIASGSVDQDSDPVLIVGAGLSAADAVLCAHHLNIPVYHAFRRVVSDPAMIFNQLPKVLYPEYHKVHQMMRQQKFGSGDDSCYPGYTSYPQYRVVHFTPDRKCILQCGEDILVVKISRAVVLIGAYPNLSFIKDGGKYLGLDTGKPISCHRNPIDIDPYTYECIQEPGLFAMGPLVGDNFVRFLKGGALGITSCLSKRLEKQDTEDGCNCTAVTASATYNR
ncbi:oxidative stress-induced growth inhibitor 2 [Protopterus annectens]|uniref:oxidative stress-induced growth inhibitor 2 n=1 Tax=Protopterus annectens TaxID=7888 RepID=UPI001CF946CE|nr:oxidative stress-induced growth inhibitor 2 [Protopterus annectens]XP_043946040.1 oxidative stress-induced growth inhibitor 2 [Protopterus annectens]XP_043946041.1 oxidative stress-induced growth inhibitor 2 [Protopterus annectens]